jgi:hypothetical protein
MKLSIPSPARPRPDVAVALRPITSKTAAVMAAKSQNFAMSKRASQAARAYTNASSRFALLRIAEIDYPRYG